MSSSTLVDPETYVSTLSASSDQDAAPKPSVALQADMSWVPIALAVFSLLVVTVMVTDTGEILSFPK